MMRRKDVKIAGLRCLRIYMSIGYIKPLYSYGVCTPAARRLTINMRFITSVGGTYCLVTLAANVAN